MGSRTVLSERGIDRPLVLQADNGSPLKGEPLLATLYRLGIATSASRPRPRNDHPDADALWRTGQYGPADPAQGGASLDAARAWRRQFVRGDNAVPLHRGIRCVTPQQRHEGLAQASLAQRQVVYEPARRRHPARWSGGLRNWQPITQVWLNPSAEGVDSPTRKAQAN